MPSNQIELQYNIHTAASRSVERAFDNARLLKQKVVTNTHLLLGILATGNNDMTLPIPRILRAAGADYRRLYEFLEGHLELAATTPGVTPQVSADASRTMARASRIAKRRANNDRQNSIITGDLIVAILRSRESLLAQALQAMGVDKSALLAELSDVKPKATRPQHLHSVS